MSFKKLKSMSEFQEQHIPESPLVSHRSCYKTPFPCTRDGKKYSRPWSTWVQFMGAIPKTRITEHNKQVSGVAYI